MKESADSRSRYFVEYAKEHKKRIPFDVRKEYYTDVLKPAAEAAGEPVNTYIKNAITMRMAADGFEPRS